MVQQSDILQLDIGPLGSPTQCAWQDGEAGTAPVDLRMQSPPHSNTRIGLATVTRALPRRVPWLVRARDVATVDHAVRS